MPVNGRPSLWRESLLPHLHLATGGVGVACQRTTRRCACGRTHLARAVLHGPMQRHVREAGTPEVARWSERTDVGRACATHRRQPTAGAPRPARPRTSSRQRVSACGISARPDACEQEQERESTGAHHLVRPTDGAALRSVAPPRQPLLPLRRARRLRRRPAAIGGWPRRLRQLGAPARARARRT